MNRFLAFTLSLLIFFLTGCFRSTIGFNYQGPTKRPADLEDYYSQQESFHTFSEEFLETSGGITKKRILIQSAFGEITVDYFATSEKNEDLVLVFPILGGRNKFANHFANYFTEHGYDTAIVHRDSKFKDPKNIDKIEEILRANIIKDRIAMDFFETIYEKKNFGSFGISRGAINATITAGIDKRLRYNVFALGATDLVDVFQNSNERKIKYFSDTIKKDKQLNDKELDVFFNEIIHTDPKNFAHYIDARDTLLVLAVLDRTVPFYYGHKLRKQMGKPETVYLLADHYTALLYTGFVPFFPDYIETEALSFYDKSFGRKQWSLKELPYRIFQLPFQFIGSIFDVLF